MTNSISYKDIAARLLDNGYEAIPIKPKQKSPSLSYWPKINYLDANVIDDLVDKYPNHGVGVKTGSVIVIDIDVPNEHLAIEFQNYCIEHIGDAPIRIGRPPKRSMFYRLVGKKISKKSTTPFVVDGEKHQVEFLASGQQSVVFGIHADTGKPYYWLDESILDISFDGLTPITEDQISALKSKFENRLSEELGTNFQSQNNLNNKYHETKVSLPTSDHPVEDALKHLDPQDYETWIAVGYALKASGINDAISIYQNWSAVRPDGSIPSNFKGSNDVQMKFDKFNPSRTSINAILTRASQNGWLGGEHLFKGILSHTSIAKHILKTLTLNKPTPVYAEGCLWVYEETHWVSLDMPQQRQLVQELDGMKAGKKTFMANASTIDGVLKELCAMCDQKDFFASPPTGVNLSNGFVMIKRNHPACLVEHHPDHRQRHTVNAVWNGGLEREPSGLFKTLLDGCFGDSNEAKKIQKIIFQLIGLSCASVSTDLTEPKAFVFYGPTAANGKSQILELIRQLLPKEAVACIPPADFAKEQFLANLIGRTVNLADELSTSKAISSDKMKQVVTGEMITAKLLYRQPIQFKPKALNIFATNALPGFHGGVDTGVERRLAVIPFDFTIPKSERVLNIGKLAAEGQADEIISIAINELSELLERGYFDLPKTIEEATEQWFHDADLIQMWFEDGGIEKHVKERPVLCKDLFLWFKDDVREIAEGAFIPGHRRFVEKIKAVLKHDPEFEVFRASDGNAVRRRVLV
ncbi:bifunctional DNA primase/polymerase [Alphaproteobacteria bacterium]|nr:bifunctional DNA primase/polymerase [Alphaproteobacteria bacterium]